MSDLDDLGGAVESKLRQALRGTSIGIGRADRPRAYGGPGPPARCQWCGSSKLPQGGCGQFVARRSVASDGVVQTTVTVELSPWASQVHCPGESGRAGRDRDPVARHADLETASIPTELDFGRYRHAQEVTDFMSIETGDPRPAPPRRWRWFGTAPPKPASSRSRRDRCPTIGGISR